MLLLIPFIWRSESKKGANTDGQSLSYGLAFVALGCFCSSFAGVYFEKMLKVDNPPSMWVRNIQLAFFSIVVGVSQMTARAVVSSDMQPFLHGFDFRIWMMCVPVPALVHVLVLFSVSSPSPVPRLILCRSETDGVWMAG